MLGRAGNTRQTFTTENENEQDLLEEGKRKHVRRTRRVHDSIFLGGCSSASEFLSEMLSDLRLMADDFHSPPQSYLIHLSMGPKPLSGSRCPSVQKERE